ncbi:serine/threonine-protein kinase [Rhodopirellula sallentina]|nr:serine/threonine-protein kinase [Rhodopirellula sallentina]
MNFTHSPNETVLDRYTIRRGIGIGGFGEVYFALSQAGKEVALKRIQRNLAVELRGVSHCLNLKHPNLVSLHDICRDSDDQAWVVMEYVAGKNLREVLDEADPSGRICRATVGGDKALPSGLTMDEVRRWFCGMAAGTGHLHSAGLVHRDLKPGNLFNDNGIIKVGDYGLSKFISSSHRSGHTESVGTLHYMAPEIGRGQYGREIDIYAMGIILYELLTGTLPFDGETPQEIVVKHLTDTPDLSLIPNDLRPVIAACLQKNPEDRPNDVGAMMAITPWANEATQTIAWGTPVSNTLESNTGESNAAEWNGREQKFKKRRSAADTPTLAADPVIQPQPTPQVVLSHPTAEEPIARAVRTSFIDLRQWWHNLERSPGSRFVIVIAAVLILMVNTRWLLPMLSLIGFFYIPYYVIRHIVLQIAEPDTYAHTRHQHRAGQPYQAMAPGAYPHGPHPGNDAAAARHQPVPARLSKAQVRQMLRQSLAQRTRTSMAAEWTTSGMISLLVAGTLLLISSVIGLRNTEISPLTLAPYVWMACVVWVGSLGLLGLGKAWESSDGDGFTRRLSASFLGAGIGVFAYLLADALMVPLDHGLGRDIDATRLPTTFYEGSAIPKAAAMMAHFGVLFALLRMWKPVDPLRRARLSLWGVMVAVVGEWIVHQMLPIPQPAGMLIAGGIIVMTQMSAPWVKTDSVNSLATSAV